MATATAPRTLHVAAATPQNDMHGRMSIARFRNFGVEVFGNTIANSVSRRSRSNKYCQDDLVVGKRQKVTWMIPGISRWFRTFLETARTGLKRGDVSFAYKRTQQSLFNRGNYRLLR